MVYYFTFLAPPFTIPQPEHRWQRCHSSLGLVSKTTPPENLTRFSPYQVLSLQIWVEWQYLGSDSKGPLPWKAISTGLLGTLNKIACTRHPAQCLTHDKCLIYVSPLTNFLLLWVRGHLLNSSNHSLVHPRSKIWNRVPYHISFYITICCHPSPEKVTRQTTV